MSVKSKVKRCNKEIKRLEEKIIELNQTKHNFKRVSEDYERDLEKLKLYENIIKRIITDRIGDLKGGMRIDRFGVEKLQQIKLDIEYDVMTDSYIMRVYY